MYKIDDNNGKISMIKGRLVQVRNEKAILK